MTRILVYVCSHIRSVALDDKGVWRHLTAEGRLGSECEASIFTEQVETSHTARRPHRA